MLSLSTSKDLTDVSIGCIAPIFSVRVEEKCFLVSQSDTM
jgi:hypothetical protein